MIQASERQFLERAIVLANQSQEPVPCGVVIVRDGIVLSEAGNSQRADNQATNHAEIKALRAANTKTQSRKLEGAIAYCSCEPCVMCLTALSYAHIARIVFVRSLLEQAPDDPIAKIDSQSFAKNLNFVPIIEKADL